MVPGTQKALKTVAILMISKMITIVSEFILPSILLS